MAVPTRPSWVAFGELGIHSRVRPVAYRGRKTARSRTRRIRIAIVRRDTLRANRRRAHGASGLPRGRALWSAFKAARTRPREVLVGRRIAPAVDGGLCPDLAFDA